MAMKIIDEQGRLFGKINVIDFLAIIFLFSLTPFFYFGYKIFIKQQPAKTQETTPQKDIIEVELPFDLIKLSPDTLKLISVGDKELDEKGQDIGEIIKLEEFEPQIYKIEMGEGRELVKEDPMLKHILATMRIKAEFKGDNIYYKNKQIMDGTAVDFVTDKYKIEAVCSPPVVNAPKDESELEDEMDAIKKNTDILKHEIDLLNDRLSAIEEYFKKESIQK